MEEDSSKQIIVGEEQERKVQILTVDHVKAKISFEPREFEKRIDKVIGEFFRKADPSKTLFPNDSLEPNDPF